jgi:hypothetical protein
MVSKRHHAVPRFYLKRFADAAGLLWLHDVHGVTVARAQPHDALVETRLYAPETGADPHDDSLEVFLAERVDGPAAQPIDKLSRGEPLSDDERQYIALFLAFQERRVPRMREGVRTFASDMANRLLREWVSRPDQLREAFKESQEVRGREITAERAEELADQFIEGVTSGAIKIEPTKMPWLHLVTQATETARVLNDMPWSVVRTPEGVEFITSDAPIVKVLTDRRVPTHYAGGWLSPSAESTFALDPKHCLVIRADGRRGRPEAVASWCRDVNRRTIMQAHRYVVSRGRDPYVDVIARKRRDPP